MKRQKARKSRRRRKPTQRLSFPEDWIKTNRKVKRKSLTKQKVEPIESEDENIDKFSAYIINNNDRIHSICGLAMDAQFKSVQALVVWKTKANRTMNAWIGVDEFQSELLKPFQPIIDKLKSINFSKIPKKPAKYVKNHRKQNLPVYHVDEIIGIWFDLSDRTIRFQVKWSGYPLNECTWELESQFLECDESLKTYRSAIEYIKQTYSIIQPPQSRRRLSFDS